MACDKNINELLNLDFATTNDGFNWVSNISDPIQNDGDQLALIPESASSEFRRGLGNIDPSNNRIRIRMNLDLFRPSGSTQESMTVLIGVYSGTTLIGEFSVYTDSIAVGEKIEYNFDRLYYYEGIAGAINLKVTFPEGYENQALLDYLIAEDYFFCEDDIRTYFAIHEFVDQSLNSVSSAFQLLEWKIDDVETLTPDFFNDNSDSGDDPLAEWFFAKANLDGSDRESETTDPITFNPFVNEWGLEFENDPGNYYGGKPIGTINGNDYGSGVLTIGLDKPVILNGVLNERKGAFFIDLDYSKNLKVSFNILVNNTNSNVFNSPDIFRKYTIVWDAENCQKSFYYQDQLSQNPNEIIPIDEDGFLSGLTGTESTQASIACDEQINYSGEQGVFEFTIDFGTEIGEAGINYEAFSVPDKFEIEWDGNIVSSGYVGLNTFDQDLINLGINPSEINTGNPSTGNGQLRFTKTSASPNTAIIRVTAPLKSTGWIVAGVCPDGVIQVPPTVEIDTVKNSYELEEEVTFNVTSNDTDGTIVSWEIDFGDGTTQNGAGSPPATITKEYSTIGTKLIVITVTDNDGLTGSDSTSLNVFSNAQYTTNGVFFASCSSQMNGQIEVLFGTIVVLNEFIDTQGTPYSAEVTIDGQTLFGDDQHVLGVGVYPFTSTVVNCAGGVGYNELKIL